MRVDVLLGEGTIAPADVAGRVVVVVDVLRAATSAAAALASGARAVIPCDDVDDAVQRARQFARADVRLAGERRMQRIEGFDLGNSPAEYTPEAVGGRTVLFCTTNGTRALHAAQGGVACFFGAYVTLSATIAAVRLATRPGHDVVIVCSGQERRMALEDVACAGALAAGITRGRAHVRWSDGARTAALVHRRWGAIPSRLAGEAAHAQALADAGFAPDVAWCLTRDRHPFAVGYVERQLVRHDLPDA